MKPLGFEYKNIWRITMDFKGADKETIRTAVPQFENILKSFPEVEEMTLANALLFFPDAINMNDVSYNNKEVRTDNLRAGDKFPEIMNFPILRGRWFDETDNAVDITPVVINYRLRDELFGDENPLGKIINIGENEFKVIGLIGEFRRAGELTGSKKIMFRRLSEHTEEGINYLTDTPYNRILVKVKPGTGMDFEAKMLRELSSVAKNFNFTARPLEEVRDTAFNKCIILPIILLIISGFFITNVSLGLFGVIWYSISRRTGEIGLRRALGAPAAKIYQQILGEVLTITTFSVVIGSFFALQFPLLKIIGFISTTTYLLAFALSLIFIYLITGICALYPSRLASKIQPAEALHDE